MRYSLLFLFCTILLGSGHAATPLLLEQAADKWLGERDNWAFTLLVREFDGSQVKEVRQERYDPSKPGITRWELLSVNDRPPTDERRAEWQKHKTKKRKNPGKPLNDYLEFDQATLVKEDDRNVSYHLPLRNNHNWLFPVDKVSLLVTVNKSTLAVEDIVASIDEPFKVALGLARVLDVDFDMHMNPSKKGGAASDPAAAKPDGTARVVVHKLGERIEYAWSKFQRVTPHPDNVIAVVPEK